jgi:hypothetical protein
MQEILSDVIYRKLTSDLQGFFKVGETNGFPGKKRSGLLHLRQRLTFPAMRFVRRNGKT